MIKTHKIKIYPNKTMLKEITSLFNYRRYIWNQALGLWNDMYDESLLFDDKSLRPNERIIRHTLVANKEDWQYSLSSRVLQQTTIQLEKAWKNFFNPNMPNHERPKFKSKKNYKPSFTTDTARVKDGKLLLDKPHGVDKAKWYGIRLADQPRFSGKLKLVTVVQEADGLYVSLAIDTQVEKLLPKKQDVAGVDVNVKRFNYNEGICEIYPKKLERYYSKITFYQRVLARKREDNPHNFKTKRYMKVKTKLRHEYQKVANLQNDILQKFTSNLINQYGEIHIEDLNVHGMMMSKHMGKNLHRSMFGKLSEVLTYKCKWYNRKLVLVNRLYPSTQLCSECGFRKTNDTYGGKQTLSGDSIHHQHQTYYCYECGLIIDRDVNAVQNIIKYGLA